MIRNGKDIANGTVISTQVCIIGSGPAGVTAAWHLQKAGLKVTLIEGSRDYGTNWQASWPDKAKLYDGVADGLFATNEPKFLILPQSDGGYPSERERVFGGTSTHWGGQSRPLDPITFEERPGFPGWPISRKKLDPFYAKAAEFCKLHGNDFSAKTWATILDASVPNLEGFDTEMYQFIGPDYRNFSTRKFDGGTTIGKSPVDVILNASLLEIEQAQGAARSLRVASMSDGPSPKKATEFIIKADIFVLACGAVANATQLLLSNAGNEYDQVGRYFMCHPLSNNIVSAGGYLNDAEIKLMGGGGWTDSNGVTVTGRFSPNADQQKKYGIGSCWFWAGYDSYYFEMAPNSDSRVTLADTRDPVFGQRQTHITWALSARDEETYKRTTDLFKTAVKARKGTAEFASWDVVKSRAVVNGHHIGTTRMSADPKQGVVDENLKVHFLKNLFVAGASVFPSAGISNPTFTIITLSIRLAEHLTGLLQ